ncbi:MAG: hypothetical protein F6K32_25150, partial [Desertifilum sp. SIO1I2]|nr:hypothetical protein [Desertifilum sp. SIO1I2]
PNTPLYAAPLPNVYPDGAICFGEAHPPSCTALQIRQAWEIFWKSNFSDHLVQNKSKRYPQDVLQQLIQVANKKRYSVKDLVPFNSSLSDVLKIINR